MTKNQGDNRDKVLNHHKPCFIVYFFIDGLCRYKKSPFAHQRKVQRDQDKGLFFNTRPKIAIHDLDIHLSSYEFSAVNLLPSTFFS